MQMLVSKLAESALAPGIVDPISRQDKIYNVCTEKAMEHYDSTTEDTTSWPDASEGYFSWLTTEMTAPMGHKWVLLKVGQWTICSYEQ